MKDYKKKLKRLLFLDKDYIKDKFNDEMLLEIDLDYNNNQDDYIVYDIMLMDSSILYDSECDDTLFYIE